MSSESELTGSDTGVTTPYMTSNGHEGYREEINFEASISDQPLERSSKVVTSKEVHQNYVKSKDEDQVSGVNISAASDRVSAQKAQRLKNEDTITQNSMPSHSSKMDVRASQSILEKGAESKTDADLKQLSQDDCVELATVDASDFSLENPEVNQRGRFKAVVAIQHQDNKGTTGVKHIYSTV